MNVTVESTSDSPEAVTAATGGLAKDEKAVDTSEPLVKKPESEKPDESETSKNEDSEKDEVESGDEPDTDDAKDDEGKPKKKGFKKRIEKLSRRLSDKEREAEYWRAEALKSQGANQETQPIKAKENASQPDADKPKADDFDSHEAYVEALADWKVEKKLKEKETKAKEAEVKTQYQEQVTHFQKKVLQFQASREDFQEVLEDVDDIQMSPAVREAILTSENGPELMYELAKNRTEYERICSLPAVSAAREIGRFEARIQTPESPKVVKETKTTKAPKPLSPVGTKTAAVSKSMDDMDYDEFKRARMEQLKRGA
jgi:hypothetical protein